MPHPLPLSLYIHLPWCVKKCPYCDFNSHEKNHSFDEEKYVQALLIDLDDEYKDCQTQLFPRRTLSSMFFGGGTPSLFSAGSIKKIIDHARKLFKFDDIEITLEANPGTFEQEKFNDFYNAGVNRLSIGIQSFNQQHLLSLGRIHDSVQAKNAIATARLAGFENINLDLMFGLPQQSIQQAIEDVTIASEFDIPHISHYQLTIEQNTYFYKHTPVLPETDLLWEMQTQCQHLLADKGYHQYEISAYSKTGRQCLHNLNYWQFGDYIGIGAGAHGKISNIDIETDEIKIIRRWKHRQPQQYIEQALTGEATSGDQILDQQDIVFEFLLNALRLKDGCNISSFERHTALDARLLREAVKNIDPDLLYVETGRIKTTDRGYLFLNSILEDLV
ncbi:MAG: radical SAM family heme chaperone HemW [Gammaproteobacteria bacterium]|nr:radical SAM family heme chaperone HemW [Gammaproteobacteria bacterium]